MRTSEAALRFDGASKSRSAGFALSLSVSEKWWCQVKPSGAICGNRGKGELCFPFFLYPGRSKRYENSKVSMTMEVYAYVLPDMQRMLPPKLGALPHG